MESFRKYSSLHKISVKQGSLFQNKHYKMYILTGGGGEVSPTPQNKIKEKNKNKQILNSKKKEGLH